MKSTVSRTQDTHMTWFQIPATSVVSFLYFVKSCDNHSSCSSWLVQVFDNILVGEGGGLPPRLRNGMVSR